MPIWLRRFVFNKLKEYHQEDTPADIKKSPIINRPDVAASYTTRASTK